MRLEVLVSRGRRAKSSNVPALQSEQNFGFAQPSCHFVKADDQSRAKWPADYVEMPLMRMPHPDPLEGLIGGTQAGPPMGWRGLQTFVRRWGWAYVPFYGRQRQRERDMRPIELIELAVQSSVRQVRRIADDGAGNAKQRGNAPDCADNQHYA